MARPRTNYTEAFRFTTSPEALTALRRLSESTGLAQTHLARLALNRFLVDAGVLAPGDLTPTPTTRRRQA